jgi:(E)-4-hydroxy-3-methylbut-2-enyl-diphosphate synthase
MEEEGMNYPLHLGVTEAGGGEDGRVKSALGIGTLLEDGIGDTVRVSLTEDPEFEAPVAIDLVNRYKFRSDHKFIKPIEEPPFDPFIYERRYSFEVLSIGAHNVPQVVADFSTKENITYSDFNDIGYSYNEPTDKWNMSDGAADIIYLGKNTVEFNIPRGIKAIYDFDVWKGIKEKSSSFPLFTSEEYFISKEKGSVLNFVKVTLESLTDNLIEKLKHDHTVVLILETNNTHGMPEQRRAFFELIGKSIKNPVIIKRNYENVTLDELRLFSSTDFGALLIDGFGDGVWAEVKNISEKEDSKIYVRSFIKKNESIQKITNRILFGILQAARARISKTEYIACPSCGRTLFDLQETTEMIRKRTEHLKGVKIAIMGCIVNGPGEMADADYGYVGSGVGKITLYRGKDIVRRNLPMTNAVDSLIEIIKEDNNWTESNK